MIVEHKELPFFDGTLGVSLDAFAGRDDLRKLFAELTWDRKREKRQDYVLVLEGRTSFGKSSMKDWCLGEMKRKAPQGDVVICTIDLKSDFNEQGTVKGNFYKALFDRMYETFVASVKEKSRAWKWVKLTWLGKRFIRRLSELELMGHNPIKGAKFKQFESQAYFDFIKELNKGAKIELKAYCVIIDNVSHKEGGPQLCADLLMDLRTYADARMWPVDFPNFLLVLLPLPGWDDEKTGANKSLKEIGIHRRIIDKGAGSYEKLEAFSQAEIQDFVQERCLTTGWTYDEKAVIPALFHTSGGIPLLMQSIGVRACRASKSRNSNYHLTDKDVIAALKAPDFDSYIEEIINNALEFHAEDYLHSREDRKVLPLFYMCQLIENLDWGGRLPPIITGTVKNEWKNVVLRPTDRSSEIEKSFDKLWEAFIKHRILVQKDGKYRFHAEAIRRYFNVFNPQ